MVWKQELNTCFTSQRIAGCHTTNWTIHFCPRLKCHRIIHWLPLYFCVVVQYIQHRNHKLSIPLWSVSRSTYLRNDGLEKHKIPKRGWRRRWKNFLSTSFCSGSPGAFLSSISVPTVLSWGVAARRMCSLFCDNPFGISGRCSFSQKKLEQRHYNVGFV